MSRLVAVVLVACLGLSACGSSEDRSVASAGADPKTPPSAMVAPPEDVPTEARPFPHWDYTEKTDPMTDKTVRSARISSKEVIDLPFPYAGQQSATLVLRTGTTARPEAMLFIRRGQLMCHDSYDGTGCPIRVRFDAGYPDTVDGSPSSDNDSKVVFFPIGTDVVERMIASKQFRAEMTLFQAGDHIFTFDMSGLDSSKLAPPKTDGQVSPK